MTVIPLLVLCSLVLVGFAIVLFCYSVKTREHEHVDRLSLLPLEDDDAHCESDTEREPAARPPSP